MTDRQPKQRRHSMHRSVFLARLMGPTFIAIALGMLINLGM
jgi:hypothetical protein